MKNCKLTKSILVMVAIAVPAGFIPVRSKTFNTKALMRSILGPALGVVFHF